MSSDADDREFRRVNAGVWRVPNYLRPKQAEMSVKAFHVSRTEVTVAEFREFAEATSYVTDCESGVAQCGSIPVGKYFPQSIDNLTWRDAGYEQSEQHPVVALSRTDMERFCEWKTSVSVFLFPLPTVAEWKVGFEGEETLAQLNANPSDFSTFRDLALATVDNRIGNPGFDDGCIFAVAVTTKQQIAGCYFPFGNGDEVWTFPATNFLDLASSSFTFCGSGWLSKIEDVRSTMPTANSDVFITNGFRLVREDKADQ